MKLFIATVLLLASTTSFAAVQIELGKYHAVDKKTGKEQVADFTLKADGTATLSIKSGFVSVSCKGKYEVKDDHFLAEVKCNSLLLPETSVDINIANVTPEGLRTPPGVVVAVMLDIFDAPQDFYLTKVDPKP